MQRLNKKTTQITEHWCCILCLKEVAGYSFIYFDYPLQVVQPAQGFCFLNC